MWDWIKGHAAVVSAICASITILLTVFNVAWGIWIGKKNLKLAKRDFSKKWHTDLHVRVIHHASYVHALEVTNLGAADASLSAILLRRADLESARIEEFRLREVIPSGKNQIIPITRELREYLNLHKPGSLKKDRINVAFRYGAAGEDCQSSWFSIVVHLESGVATQIDSEEAHARIKQT